MGRREKYFSCLNHLWGLLKGHSVFCFTHGAPPRPTSDYMRKWGLTNLPLKDITAKIIVLWWSKGYLFWNGSYPSVALLMKGTASQSFERLRSAHSLPLKQSVSYLWHFPYLPAKLILPHTLHNMLLLQTSELPILPRGHLVFVVLVWTGEKYFEEALGRISMCGPITALWDLHYLFVLIISEARIFFVNSVNSAFDLKIKWCSFASYTTKGVLKSLARIVLTI